MPGRAQAAPSRNRLGSGGLNFPAETIFSREKVPYCMRKYPKPKYSSSHHWRPFQDFSRPIHRARKKWDRGKTKNCTSML